MNNNPTTIPLPLVTFSRAVNVSMVVISLIFQSPWPVVVIFFIRLIAIVGGPRYNLVGYAGRLLLARYLPDAEREDMRPARFNNGVAAVLFGLSTLFFALGVPVIAWVFALMVAAASGLALAGFCVGCFLYYQFNLQRYRFFGK